MKLPTLALSIRQPWAYLILHAGKDIENRNWKTNYRGRILIHAAKGMTRDEYEHGFDVSEDAIAQSFTGIFTPPPLDDLERGGIVGSVEIVDCVTRSHSPWFFGDYGFVLKDPKLLPFYPFKGQLGFFKCEYPNLENFLTTSS